MARAVTADPAMLIFLNGIDNDRDYPNENYGRELMELFTLGADRGAYSEDDVRELARALTGWRADWSEARGLHNFRFDERHWDPNFKTVFGADGKFNWEDAVRLVVDHPLHASFFVYKLWSYFIPEPPSRTSPPSSSGCTSSRATRSGPCSRRSCARRSSTRGRA